MAPICARRCSPGLLVHLLALTALLDPALSSTAYSTEETRFVCTVLPPDVETACPIVPEDEAQENLLRLKESLLRQKERVAEHRDTIRELTGKLQRCEQGEGQGKVLGKSSQVIGDPPPRDPAEVVEHLRGTVRSIMNRVEALEQKYHLNNNTRNSLERWTSHETRTDSSSASSGPDGPSDSPLAPAPAEPTAADVNVLPDLQPDEFQISFPLRTNYMYARLRRSLPELNSFTICLWMRTAGPAVGTPFSYAVPNQPNELVLMEWVGNPMELVINDKIASLKLHLQPHQWHHVCVTWTTRDGKWKAYQDGQSRNNGQGLAPWRPIKGHGVFVLGQEQDTTGGNFDATQAFLGDLAQLYVWDRVLLGSEVATLAACGDVPPGEVLSWDTSAVETHGGALQQPFSHCSKHQSNF
uniref:neuronal pentraxin-2-like n=1 Tax=Myxine glutinosa TaxID=7769 RepID=UPI00358FE5B2